MPLYLEGVLWYLVLLDALIYNAFAWTQGKKHNKVTHWVSDYFVLNKFLGCVYLVLVLWLGFALWRMQILLFR